MTNNLVKQTADGARGDVPDRRRCGWNPTLGCAATHLAGDCPNGAVFVLGRGRRAWYLCPACADLPRFSRFSKMNRAWLVYKEFDAGSGVMLREVDMRIVATAATAGTIEVGESGENE